MSRRLWIAMGAVGAVIISALFLSRAMAIPPRPVTVNPYQPVLSASPATVTPSAQSLVRTPVQQISRSAFIP